jgi:hypothetical protein
LNLANRRVLDSLIRSLKEKDKPVQFPTILVVFNDLN